MIHANIPLENWFMVGNPVPQRTQSIELVVQFPTFRLRGEYQMQVCTPESVVVGLAEWRHPEPEVEFGHNTPGRSLFAQLLVRPSDTDLLRRPEQEGAIKPILPTAGSQGAVYRVSQCHFESLQRPVEGTSERGVSKVHLDSAPAVAFGKLKVGAEPLR